MHSLLAQQHTQARTGAPRRAHAWPCRGRGPRLYRSPSRCVAARCAARHAACSPARPFACAPARLHPAPPRLPVPRAQCPAPSACAMSWLCIVIQSFTSCSPGHNTISCIAIQFSSQPTTHPCNTICCIAIKLPAKRTTSCNTINCIAI